MQGTQPSTHWQELRDLLHEKVVLQSSVSDPLKGKTGRTVPWVAYIWRISLGAQGAQLAGRCLLDKLTLFDATQLASHGYAGLPLVTACVLLGNGRYSALSVRHERKSYGAGRLIDGDGDRSRPIVVVDDCLVSGNSFSQAASALESEGYRVEGLVCLMDFPGRGGRSWAEAHGYRVEAVFDVWTDLQLPRPGTPSWCRPPRERPAAGTERAGGPAAFARLAARQYVAAGTVPAPMPGASDPSAGGVFVSIRNRLTGERLARRGFFRLPPGPGSPFDLGNVTADAVDGARRAIASTGFENLAFGVTFIGELEPVLPRQLDVSRYGIVVQSEVDPWRVGAALPNTESATTEIEQYREACAKARIMAGEPHVLYRHSVTKDITDSARWPPFGAPAADTALPAATAGLVGDRLWRLVGDVSGSTGATGAGASGRPDSLAPLPPMPYEIQAVGVSLYARGRLCGCWVSGGDSFEESLTRAVRGAWADARFADHRASVNVSELVAVISLLHHRQIIGPCDPATVIDRFRLGLDTIGTAHQGRDGLILSHVPCYYDWSAERTLEHVLKKASADEGTRAWYTYQTASLLCRPGKRPQALDYGFPSRPARRRKPAAYPRDAMLLGGYLVNQIGSADLPPYCYYPVHDSYVIHGPASRVILALGALNEAGLVLGVDDFRGKARRGLEACLGHVERIGERHRLRIPGLAGGAGAECLLVTALATMDATLLSSDSGTHLIGSLSALFHPDGSISPLPPGRRTGTEDEILPGAALLAAARVAAAARGGPLAGACDLTDQILRWYRRRFRVRPSWAMVSWHAQAWTAVHAMTHEAEHAAFVFELADWAIDRQLRKDGAFLTDLWHDGPSFHTAVIAEGVAAAWELADRLGDKRRARTYAASWRAAMDFMDRLIMRPGDTFCMPRPMAAIGGVRLSPASAQLRIDYTGHLLFALANGARLLREHGSGGQVNLADR